MGIRSRHSIVFDFRTLATTLQSQVCVTSSSLDRSNQVLFHFISVISSNGNTISRSWNQTGRLDRSTCLEKDNTSCHQTKDYHRPRFSILPENTWIILYRLWTWISASDTRISNCLFVDTRIFQKWPIIHEHGFRFCLSPTAAHPTRLWLAPKFLSILSDEF